MANKNVSVGCGTPRTITEGQLRERYFESPDAVVTPGSPDTVQQFQITALSGNATATHRNANDVIDTIQDGRLRIQTSNYPTEAEIVAFYNAGASTAKTAVYDAAAPIQETVNNGTGNWTFIFEPDVTLKGGTLVQPYMVTMVKDSPFNVTP